MQDAKEEVRARLNIEEVVGEYVQLQRAGRNFKGLSPFTGEKTASFYVSPEKNIWHDFSSNKGGDIFSFVMEVEGLEFREALELLARKAGIDMAQYSSKAAQAAARDKKRSLEAHELAAQYYQKSLVSNQRAIEYVFKKRGLSKEVVTTFRIGYAPDSGDALVAFLAKKGFRRDELAKAGLTNRFGGDLFRGRMMVPLMDSAGQVIGFTARILVDDPKAPKYLNTPQTHLYDKSRHVFGLSQAKEAMRQRDEVVIVEGNLDVVSSHQAGVRYVVATAGTAMTEHHLKALVRTTPNVRLAFDGDAAGLAATERAITIAEQVGVELTIISLPSDTKDPDELIQKDAKLWEKAIADAEPAVDWLIRQYAHKEDVSTPGGKRRFTTAVLQVLRLLQDPVEQDHYLQKIADLADTTKTALEEKLRRQPSPEPAAAIKPSKAPLVSPDFLAYQDNLLALTLIHSEVRPVLADVTDGMFATDERRAVFEHLQQNHDALLEDIARDLQKYDTYVKILILKADTRYGQWSDTDRAGEVSRLVRQLTTEHKKLQKEQLTQQLRAAEESGDEVAATTIRQQLNELIKEIARA